jgi:hypothetical protein
VKPKGGSVRQLVEKVAGSTRVNSWRGFCGAVRKAPEITFMPHVEDPLKTSWVFAHRDLYLRDATHSWQP